jgi:hypothetical protein
MRVVYKGPKQKRVTDFPMPVLSRGEIEETITFKRDVEMEVKDKWGEQLMQFCPDSFTCHVLKKG